MVLSVPADSPYFKGHFPEFALLPGVVQVQWAKDIACRYWNLEVALFGVKALKFMSPIRPDDTVVLKLTQRFRYRLYLSKPTAARFRAARLSWKRSNEYERVSPVALIPVYNHHQVIDELLDVFGISRLTRHSR